MICLDKGHRRLDGHVHANGLPRMEDAPLEHTTLDLGDTSADTVPVIHQKHATAARTRIAMLQDECHLLEHELEADTQVSTQVSEGDISPSHVGTSPNNLVGIQPVIDAILLCKLSQLLDRQIWVIAADQITKHEGTARLSDAVRLCVCSLFRDGMNECILTERQVEVVRGAFRLIERSINNINLVRDVQLGGTLHRGNILLMADIDARGARDGEAVLRNQVIGRGTSSTAKIDVAKVARLGPVGQKAHAESVHVVCHGLGRATIRTGLFSVEAIPLPVVDESGVVSKDV
mmetsp:Transcript_14438/g.31396  ORF Transcript_14438/g.31396 Transcript_14438/m.31396 type:complete len:290 (+) Transcript_14438:1625-2494(+)